MKYLKIACICIIIILMVCSNTTMITGNDVGNRKIKDIFSFDEKMEIIIKEVYFRKEKVPPVDEGQEIIIDIKGLKDMFLNDAIVVSGEEINYMFEYETVSVIGVLKNNKKTYDFDYNLAGFGTVFLNDTEFVLYGDGTKLINQ